MNISGKKAIEFFHICLASWWGFCLLLPSDTFGTYKGYAAMAQLAPETVWGLFSLSIAIGQAFSMAGKHRRFLPIGLAYASFHWSFIAAMLFMNDLRLHAISTGSGTYILVAALVLWLSNNTGGDQNGY